MGKLIGSSIDLFCLQRLAVADLEPLPTSWACKCNAKKGRYLGSVEEKSLTWHEHILNKKSWSIVLLQLVLFSLFVLYNTRVERAPHVWEGFWQGFDLEILSLSEFQYIYIYTHIFVLISCLFCHESLQLWFDLGASWWSKLPSDAWATTYCQSSCVLTHSWDIVFLGIVIPFFTNVQGPINTYCTIKESHCSSNILNVSSTGSWA